MEENIDAYDHFCCQICRAIESIKILFLKRYSRSMYKVLDFYLLRNMFYTLGKIKAEKYIQQTSM